MITIDKVKCTKCGVCYAVCPAMVMEFRKGAPAEYAHGDLCIKCFHCVAVCPAGAVTCGEFSLSEFKPAAKKGMATPAALRTLLDSRRSIREFKDKPVPRELLEEIIADAANAPSGHNDRGIQLTVITDRKVIENVDQRILKTFSAIAGVMDNPLAKTIVKTAGGKKTADSLESMLSSLEMVKSAEGVRRFIVFRGAPILIVAHAGLHVATGREDSVIAIDQMMLAANARGLGATWIGLVVGAAKLDPGIKKHLGVPAKNTLHAAMILGWPKYSYKRYMPTRPPKVKWIE